MADAPDKRKSMNEEAWHEVVWCLLAAAGRQALESGICRQGVALDKQKRQERVALAHLEIVQLKPVRPSGRFLMT